MNDSAIRRVQFFDDQYLRTKDFVDEQAYHIAMRRRHNIAHHTWGIVDGLQLERSKPEQPSSFILQPGMAIDGYGRELIVNEVKTIETKEFGRRDSDTLDVWLHYSRQDDEEAPHGYFDPGTTKQKRYYRWREEPVLLITIADREGTPVDRRQPPGCTPGDSDFSPARPSPDDPARQWLVFVGQIWHDPADKENPYKVNMNGRPYAGLRGQAIETPSRSAAIELGSHDDQVRFAIFVAKSDAKPAVEGPPTLTIDREGQIEVNGDTTLQGKLVLKAKLELPQTDETLATPTDPAAVAPIPAKTEVAHPALEFEESGLTTKQPWRIYRTREKKYNTSTVKEDAPLPTPPANGTTQGDTEKNTEKNTEKDTASTSAPASNTSTSGKQVRVKEVVSEVIEQQLRIELPPKGGGLSAVAIGAWSTEENKFLSILTVDNEGKVTVRGNLVVEGKLIEKQPRSQPLLTPEAQRVAIASSLTGMSTTSSLVGTFYSQSRFASPDAIKTLLHSESGVQSIVDSLAKLATDNIKRLQEVSDGMVKKQEVQATLIESFIKLADPRDKLFVGILKDSSAIKDLSEHLGDDLNAQEAIFTALNDQFIQILLTKDEHVQELVTQIRSSVDARILFLGQLGAEANGALRLAIFDAFDKQVCLFVVTTKERIQEFFEGIKAEPAAQDRFVKQLGAGDNDALQQAILAELNDEAIDYFLAEETRLQALVDASLAQHASLVAKGLLAGASETYAEEMLTNNAGLSALLTKLDGADPVHFNAFVNLLNSDDFKVLAGKLKTALPDIP